MEAKVQPGDSHANASKRRASMRVSHIFITLVVAVLLPVLTLAFYLMAETAETAKRTEERKISSVADALRNTMDQMLVAQLRTAWAVASSQNLQTGELATLAITAKRVAMNAGGHIILSDEAGRQIVDTRTLEPQVLETGTVTPHADAIAGGGSIGNLGSGVVDGELLYAVTVPVLVGSEEKYRLSYVPEKSGGLRLFDQLYLPDGWFAAVMDGDDRIVVRSQRHNEFLGQKIEDHHREIMRGQPDYAETIDKEGRPVAVSARRSSISGWSVVVGVPLVALQTPVQQVRQKFALLALVALTLSLIAAYVGGRFLQAPTEALAKAAEKLGKAEEIDAPEFFMREANQIAVAMRCAQGQIKKREADLLRSEDHLRLVMREMSHRAMNLLSVIQALSKQTVAHSTSLPDFQERFAGRLAGLAQSHRLLIEADWTAVDIGDLARHQLGAFGQERAERVGLRGAPFSLDASVAQNIGMAFHELATNAIKHGALASEDGHIVLSWALETAPDREPVLVVKWEEFSPTITDTKQKAGFGSVLLDQAVAAQCGGSSRTEWHEGRMVWELRVPPENVQVSQPDAFAQADDNPSG